LNCLVSLNRTECTDDRVARTCHNARIGIDASRAVTKFAHKTIPDAGEIAGFGLFEPQVIEEAPNCNGNPGQPPAADAAEPANQERCIAPGDPVRNEKIDVFLKKDIREDGSCTVEYGFHRSFKR